ILVLYIPTDVIVHRLLAATLGIYKLPPIFQDRPQLTSISNSKNLLCYATYINGQKKIRADLNYRHRNAQMASRASVELHTLIYFRKRYPPPQHAHTHHLSLSFIATIFSCRPTDTETRIVKIRANGFIVFVPKYGIEGPVYLTPRGEKGGDWFVDEEH
ncbi:hypothetical protein IFM89_009244, partial [Coptis chinensis]